MCLSTFTGIPGKKHTFQVFALTFHTSNRKFDKKKGKRRKKEKRLHKKSKDDGAVTACT